MLQKNQWGRDEAQMQGSPSRSCNRDLGPRRTNGAEEGLHLGSVRMDLINSPPRWEPLVVLFRFRTQALLAFMGIQSPCWHGSCLCLTSSLPLFPLNLHLPCCCVVHPCWPTCSSMKSYILFFLSLSMCYFLCWECRWHLWPLYPSYFHFDVSTSGSSHLPPKPVHHSCILSTLFSFLPGYFIVKHPEQDPAHSRFSKTCIAYIHIINSRHGFFFFA